jgi:uncharacterized membrane protein YfcA
MHLDMAAAGLVVGFVIGLTGMGGGALMTPVLVIFFGVSPSAAVSSDVIASLVLKPIGGGVHVRRGTVHWPLVRWLMVGSVPAAFAGSILIDRVFHADAGHLKTLLGWVLLVAAGAIVAKYVIVHFRAQPGVLAEMPSDLIRPGATIAIGAIGGLVVGLTSVGSGSLIIVMLMLLYPRLSARQMVGTDLVQAIPLVGSAALGHAIFGDPQIAVIGSVLVGAVPAVWIGAHVSSRAADHWIRPALVFVLALSALKLLGVSNEVLGGLLGAGAAVAAAGLLITRWRAADSRRVPERAEVDTAPQLASDL